MLGFSWQHDKSWKPMWAGAQQLEEHMEPQSLPFCIGKRFNSLMCRMRIGEAACKILPKSCCGKPGWIFGLVAWRLILRSYMILLVSPLRGLEIHPKGSDHPSWIGINLGDLQNTYRMSRGEFKKRKHYCQRAVLESRANPDKCMTPYSLTTLKNNSKKVGQLLNGRATGSYKTMPFFGHRVQACKQGSYSEWERNQKSGQNILPTTCQVE